MKLIERPTTIKQVLGSNRFGRLTFFICTSLVRQRKVILRITSAREFLVGPDEKR